MNKVGGSMDYRMAQILLNHWVICPENHGLSVAAGRLLSDCLAVNRRVKIFERLRRKMCADYPYLGEEGK
jgi:hypothetical protein